MEFSSADPVSETLTLTTTFENSCLNDFLNPREPEELEICVVGLVLHGLGSFRTSGVVKDQTSTYFVDFSQMATIGLAMYSTQINMYVRSTAFLYDGIRLTTDGYLEMYRDYPGGYVSSHSRSSFEF